MGSIVRGTGGRNAARVHHDGPPGCGWAGGFYTPPVPSVEGTCFVDACVGRYRFGTARCYFGAPRLNRAGASFIPGLC